MAARRFAVDKMLGRLATWLRLIGEDATYGPHLTGHALIRHARAEGRIVLTRDGRLRQTSAPPEVLFIHSDHFREQLYEVITACGLVPLTQPFTRCSRCNTALVPIPKAVAGERVPPYVLATQERFVRCPSCQRIYWPATHHQHVLDELRRLGVTRPDSGDRRTSA